MYLLCTIFALFKPYKSTNNQSTLVYISFSIHCEPLPQLTFTYKQYRIMASPSLTNPSLSNRTTSENASSAVPESDVSGRSAIGHTRQDPSRIFDSGHEDALANDPVANILDFCSVPENGAAFKEWLSIGFRRIIGRYKLRRREPPAANRPIRTDKALLYLDQVRTAWAEGNVETSGTQIEKFFADLTLEQRDLVLDGLKTEARE